MIALQSYRKNYLQQANVHKYQAGFTLIELMISLLLSSFLMFGLMQVYLSNTQTGVVLSSHSRAMESGRVMIDIMTREARMADFRGCADIDKVNNHLDITDQDYIDNYTTLLEAGIDGLDNTQNLLIGDTSVVSGTDVLILRGSSDACSGSGRVFSASKTAASFKVSSTCDLEISQVVMITNCKSGELFSITNAQAGGGAGLKTFVHNTGNKPGVLIKNATKTFSQTYGADSTILVPYEKRYFLAEGVNGTSSLYVSDTGVVSEIVPNVTDLQFSYGEDTNNNGSVNVYRVAGAAGQDMDNVKNVRIEVTVSDGRHEELFDTVINLRNR